MPLAGQQIHQRCVHPGPLVLGTTPLKLPAPMVDRDRTVSRRSEPSSRTALMGEQPNPWERLHPQDATSRHRALFRCYQRRRLSLHPSCKFAGEGSAYCGVHRFALTAENATSSFRTQSLRGHTLASGLPTVLPTFGAMHPGVGSTVISRFVTGISAGPPQI